MSKKSPDKKPCKFKVDLTSKHIKMIYDIRCLTEKYENPYGVNKKGQIGTFPDAMFVILLEEELFELKERLGLPISHCPHCDESINDISELAKASDEDYMAEILKMAKENMKYFEEHGIIKRKDRFKQRK
jgi:hypothetical protein